MPSLDDIAEHLAIEPVSTTGEPLTWLVYRRYSALSQFALEQLDRMTHLTRERPLMQLESLEELLLLIPPIPTSFADGAVTLIELQPCWKDQSLLLLLETR